MTLNDIQHIYPEMADIHSSRWWVRVMNLDYGMFKITCADLHQDDNMDYYRWLHRYTVVHSSHHGHLN